MAMRASGYGTVYILEIGLLLIGLAAIGPLVGHQSRLQAKDETANVKPFGLTEFPT
ncbi:MAG: hypothetical protein HC793_04805 [Aquincola sp.]|nr:hypothetical protein [Aquincola sp.]